MARNLFATQPAPAAPAGEGEQQPAADVRKPINLLAADPYSQTAAGKTSLPEGTLEAARQKGLESKYSKLDSAMLGVADSAALGFSDEIAGGAVGLWGAVQDPMNFGQRFSEGYDATTKSVRQMQEEASEANPWSYGGGQLLGAVPSMFVGGAGLRGAGLVGKTLIGARNAAVEGGIYGVGSGENLEDRLYRGAAGAATGAALGALPGAVGAAYTYGAKPAASGVANVVGGIFNPAGRAETLVAKSLRADAKSAAQTGTEMLRRSEVGPARARGQEPIVADMGNEVTGRLARAASNSSPEAAALLRNTAQDRFEGQGDRIVEHLDNIYGGLNSADVIDSLKAQADAVVKPLYQRAMNDPRGRSLYTAELDNMLQSPAVQRAIDKAEERSAELAVAQGATPVKNPFTRDANGRLVLNNQATGATPSLAFWDVVKRNLDDEVNALYRAGNKDVAKDIKKIRDNMRDHLDTLVPTYQHARGAAAHFFKANDAFEAGQKFASQTKEGDISNAMKFIEGLRADPARAGELDLFERGFMSSYSGKLSGMRDGRDLSKVLMGSRTDRMKMNAAVAPQRRAEIESMAKIERIMDRLRRHASGGSNTTQQLLDLGIGGVAGYAYTGDISGIALGAGALRGANFAANRRLMGEVSKLLASGAPQDIAKVSKMAAKNPAVASFIENVGNKLGTVQREVVAPVGAALASDAAARPEIDVPGGDLPEQGYKLGGAVKALTKVAKKAMAEPKPKLEAASVVEGEGATHRDIIRAMRLAAQAGVIPAGTLAYYEKELSADDGEVQTFSDGGQPKVRGKGKAALAAAALNIVRVSMPDVLARWGLPTEGKAAEKAAQKLATGLGLAKTEVSPLQWSYKYLDRGDVQRPDKYFDLDQAVRDRAVIMPLVGDTTPAGRQLLEVNDMPLADGGVRQTGGADFVYGASGRRKEDPRIWASMPGAAKKLAKWAREAPTDGPVYGMHSSMGEDSGDFAHMTMDTLKKLIRSGSITPEAARVLAARVKGKMKKNAKVSFSGLDDEGFWDDVVKNDDGRGVFRALMLGEADTGPVRSAGFPDLGPLRFANTDQNFLGTESATIGRSTARLDGKYYTDSHDPHGTYTGEVGGTPDLPLDFDVPSQLMFQDHFTKRFGIPRDQLADASLSSSQKGSLRMSKVYQIATPEWRDSLLRYRDDVMSGKRKKRNLYRP